MKNDQKPSKIDLMQAMLRQLRDAFLDELPERLIHLDNLLLVIEKKGIASAEEFNELYRGIHSIKGSGGTHGIHIITTVCHQFEDQLNSAEGHLSELPPTFFQKAFDYIELLRTAIDQARNGQGDFPEIEEKLLALRKNGCATAHSLLLVEGSQLSARMYTQFLADLPVRATVMHSGYEALLRALNEPFDILVTSQELPMLNGRALIGALRLSGSRNRAIQTILLTSSPAPEKTGPHVTDPNYVIVKSPAIATDIRKTVATIIAGFGK